MSVNKKQSFEMKAEFLQPWSTFVMKTQLPPPILERMIDITDRLVENRESATSWGHDLAGQIEDEFLIEPEILEQENLMKVFLDACRTYVAHAYCQHSPFNKEEILKEKWITELTRTWMISQKDNEYNPIHVHGACHLSAVMYLKIPEYLPVRKLHLQTILQLIKFGEIQLYKFNHAWGTFLYFQQHKYIKCIRLGQRTERVKEGVYLSMQIFQIRICRCGKASHQ
jgi:hypothetical protein